jgi:hypothetical protein
MATTSLQKIALVLSLRAARRRDVRPRERPGHWSAVPAGCCLGDPADRGFRVGDLDHQPGVTLVAQLDPDRLVRVMPSSGCEPFLGEPFNRLTGPPVLACWSGLCDKCLGCWWPADGHGRAGMDGKGPRWPAAASPGPGEVMFLAPRLSFACELDPTRLAELFADSAGGVALPGVGASANHQDGLVGEVDHLVRGAAKH